jgi:phenylacetic acid degradation operon negative regulatory protein
VRERICPDEMVEEARTLRGELSRFQSVQTSANSMNPLEAMAARALVIHAWRSLILNVSGVPDSMFPSDWVGADCRRQVSSIYSSVFRTSDDWLRKSLKDRGLEVPGSSAEAVTGQFKPVHQFDAGAANAPHPASTSVYRSF